ncbi:hypothetical protein [Nostoc sp.]|uniref:hypothetical protein n=1 Tax=Nostoc sp. TaxID=1180 RepID=UPI002FFC8553
MKEAISQAFDKYRSKTFALFQDMDEATLSSQSHSDFSRVGWYLGHIACIESLSPLKHST